MGAKGSKSKEEIFNIILKGFGKNAFINGKEIRINWAEDGEPVQLALTLTMKKDFVESGLSFENKEDSAPTERKVEERCGPPSEEEIAQVIEFMRQIGGLVE